MGFVSDVVSGIGNAVVGVVTGVVDLAGDVIKGVGDAVTGVLKIVENTVTGILKDPLPTLLQIGGAMVGIPPYVTAAVITASKGGKLEDIAKSAAVSYIASEALASTNIGKEIGKFTKTSGSDFTNYMMENYSLPADVAVSVAKAATASLNSSIIGGLNAAISGKSITSGMATGFTSGLIYSSTNSYFDSLNKDPNWGFSNKALDLMKGSASTVLNTIVSGKGDPSQALGNYIAYATINLAGTTLAQTAKDAYKVFTTDTEAAKLAQDKYVTAKAEYDTKITAGEKLRNEINDEAKAFETKVADEFTPFKTSYDAIIAANEAAVNSFNWEKSRFDENKWAYENYQTKMAQDGYQIYDEDVGNYYRMVPVTDKDGQVEYHLQFAPTKQSYADNANAAAVVANAAAEKADLTSKEAQALYDANKDMLDTLGTTKTAIDEKIAKLNVIKSDVEDPTVEGSTAAALKAASTAYQTKYDAWSKTKDAADRSAENYTKALAEVATRDATIDALNTGAITVSSKDTSGNWLLSNGMTLTSQGKFMQDGAQVFTAAAGIPQKVMDFKASDGSNVDFNENSGRLLSETDVENICRRDYGFTPTAAEIEAIAGGTYNALGNDDMTNLANKKARETYFAVVGKDPTASELETIRKTGKVIDGAADAAINGLDLPADYVFPDMSTPEKISRGQAYAAARAKYGPKAIFEWTDPDTLVTKKYTTENREEKAARLAKAAQDAQNRINLMPSNDVAGAGRGFLGGKPAGAENIYLGKKDNNVYVDTREYDALGNVTSGSLGLADDKTATNVRATSIVGQMIATGAQGFGELMQSYASGAALASGGDMSNATYNLGKALETWGKDRDGADVVSQSKNMESAIERAGKEGNIFTQIGILTKAAKDNPLGMISAMGKEVVQEGPGWAVGAVAAAGLLAVGGGVAAAALTAAGVAAAMDGIESFGAGGREAYDALKKANVPEDLAREKAIVNGAIHAAVTAPAEFLADKTLFKAYLNSVSGGVKEYAAKYGSTIATNAASEFIEAVPQNLSTQQITTGKMDLKTATAGAFYESMIGGGTATLVLGPAAINDAVIVAKDYAGNNVTLKEFMDGTRDVNLNTLDSSATIGTSNNGGTVTLGALTAVGTDIGLSNTELKTFLPASVTDYSSVVYKSADGTAVTLGNIDSIVKKNPTLDFTTVLDTVYTTSAADFKVVFSPTVLNGTADLKPATDYETTAKAAGFPSYAVYQQYGGDISAYNNAQNTNLATAAGFPDYAAYTKFNGDLAAYTASKTTPPVVTPPVVTPPVVTPPVVTPPVVTPPVVTPPVVTPPVVTPPVVTPPVVTPPVVTPPVVTPPATDVTMDAVTKAINDAIAGIQLPAGVSMDSVVTAIKNFAAQNPTLNAADVTTAIAAYMKSNPPVSMADVSTAMATATKGLATKADIATAIAGIKLPAGITTADVTSAIETYMSKNAGLSAKDVTAAVKTYMDNNPGLAAADIKATVEAATKDFATKKDIETAIAGIKFPTGITAADVSAQITAALKANPNLTAADVTKAITTYMQNNPGVSAADVSTAINAATKDLVTNASMTTALAGVTADVKTKFDGLTQGQKDIVAAQVKMGTDLNTAITNAAAQTATQIAGVKTDISNLSADVKIKFDGLTQGQKDIVDAQVKMGVDINKAIDNATKQTSEQITNVRTDLTRDIKDVQTQFNTRVDELVLQGKTYQEATQEALKELGTGVSGLQTSVTDIQEKAKQAAKVEAAKTKQANVNSGLSRAMSLIAPTLGAGLVDTSSPGFADIGLKTTGEAKFEGPLEQYLKMVKEGDYTPNPTQPETQQQNQQVAQVQDELSTPQPQPQQGSDYFNYGQQTDINDFLGGGQTPTLPFKAGGLATPLFAGGGTTRYGHYAGGGLNVVHHSGKPRLDFRTGNAVTGPGDGQSDDIPAMLADGEFVFPADVVAALGNGSTKAGSDKLYDMMHSIRAYHRSAKPKDLPPPAKKSPLDYLTKTARKARR
jgi:hypothetical protein